MRQLNWLSSFKKIKQKIERKQNTFIITINMRITNQNTYSYHMDDILSFQKMCNTLFFPLFSKES